MTIFHKNFLSNFKKIYFLIKIIRNRLIYSKIFYFIDENDNNNLKSYYLFKKNNLEKFLNKTGFFFITNKKISLKKREDLFKKLFIKIKQTNSELIYDGNCKYHTEIISTGCLQKYSINYNVENYPYKFFYFYKNNNFKLEYIGTNHRIYNFNGSFLIPGGGRTIGDSGDVDFRLNFIPDLSNKTFLDIGSEEGYSVFNALAKNAKFAKGINIKENIEYDFFPEYKRPKNITGRSRENIEKTIIFLKKIYNLENSLKIQFEYKNIYNLKDESFDFVFCFGVLYHLKNPYLAIENLYKITKETLLLETQGSLPSTNLKYSNVLGEDGFVRHSPEALKFLLLKAGFKTVEILFSGVNKQKKISNIVLKALKSNN